MDISELFHACKKGDLTTIQHLVEEKDIELNVRDKWDSTPLYYACLCGHEEVVRYLLENGAKCEAQTFDGERCLYGALNNEIRNTLKNYKAVTASSIRRDLYSEFLRRLLDRPGLYEDIHFDVHGRLFYAHRCILAVRANFFHELFKTRWKEKDSVTLTHKMVVPTAFQTLLQYLYTAHLKISMDEVEDLIRLAKYCQLDDLETSLEERLRGIFSLEASKPGVSVTVISLEPLAGDNSLNMDLGLLADRAIPLECCNQAGMELPFAPDEEQIYPDVIFIVEGHRFQCHKVFFAGRSDYFKALLLDHFGESESYNDVLIVPLYDISLSVFIPVLYYVYQDNCELNLQNVYDVLVAADMYLLPGLKRQCAAEIVRHIDITNVVNIIMTARLFNLTRLEDQCSEFMASHIETMVSSSEFAQLVRNDAKSVHRREETDSIPVIDDIRFHITSYVQTFSDMYDADQRLGVIDAFLEELGLDG